MDTVIEVTAVIPQHIDCIRRQEAIFVPMVDGLRIQMIWVYIDGDLKKLCIDVERVIV